MENLLFAAPQRNMQQSVRNLKKGKVRIIRITTIKYRVFRKTLRKKKKAKIYPTHVWFTDGSEKDYKIKGTLTAASFKPESAIDSSKISIGKSVTSIGSMAFWGCSGLTSVTIPDSVTSIGSYAFRDCSGLTSVTIPARVKSIEYGAFQNCVHLTSMTFNGKTIEQVKNMNVFEFLLSGGTDIQCSDGIIHIK